MSGNLTVESNNSSEPKRVYVYKVDHDLGINPNPFGKYCTLTTCKGSMRKAIAGYITGQQHKIPNHSVTDMGIWVIGIAGKNLEEHGTDRYGHIVYAMQVTEAPTYEEYWADSRFLYKKPLLSPQETELIKTGHKQHYRFFKGNKNYLVCGDNIEGNYERNCNHVPYKHILVSDRFEYYGVDAGKQRKLLDDLGVNYNDGLRPYRLYSSDVSKPIPEGIRYYIKNEFMNKKLLARPTFSSPEFQIPKGEKM